MTFEEASKYWTNTKGIPAPSFPVIFYEYFPPSEIFLKKDINEVIGDPDFVGYKWEEDARIIDSNGAVFKCEFLNYKNSVCGLVYPIKVEKYFQLEELKIIVAEILKIQENENKKQYRDLRNNIKKANSIQELINQLVNQYEE